MTGTTTAAGPIVIGHRFNGPAGSANGGYAAGLLARRIAGPAEVTLRHPPPLDTPLTVTADGPDLALTDGRTLVATARPAPRTATEVPASPTVAAAARAGRGSRFRDVGEHPYPRCFGCGPCRPEPDGLRIIPGPVPGTDQVADVWTPAAWLGDGHGVVRPEFLWSALDCPGGVAALQFTGARRILLGRIAAVVLAPVPVGRAVVCHAWVGASTGRRIGAGSALSTADGQLLATATATWITVG